MDIKVINGEMNQREINYYVETVKQKNPERIIDSIEMEIDGEYVNVSYHYKDVPFERIRRITGYLVGTLDRFNNAKLSEVNDRVRHNIEA